MTLAEALQQQDRNFFIARQKWIDVASTMRLYTSAKTPEELEVTLTPESFNADDWIILPVEKYD